MHATTLVVGVGWEQARLVHRAVQQGRRVVTTGTAPPPAVAGVAAHHAVATRDLEAVAAVARAEDVRAVVSDQCDEGRYAQAWLAEQLGLPGPRVADVARTCDKARARAALAGVVDQPDWRVVHDPDEAVDAARAIGLPVVVKPTDARGSIGARRADAPEEVRLATLAALAGSSGRRVLVERFVAGTVVTVDGAWDAAGHHVLAMASKADLPGAALVAEEICYPAQLAAQAVDELARVTGLVVDRLGPTSGLTHTELVWDGTTAWPLESANRAGGVLTGPVVLPALTGVDTLGLLLDEADGTPTAIAPAPTPPHAACVLRFLPLPAGRVVDVGHTDAARAVPGVLAVHAWVRPGTVTGTVRDARDRNAVVVGAGRDVAHARRAAAAGVAALDVVVAASDRDVADRVEVLV